MKLGDRKREVQIHGQYSSKFFSEKPRFSTLINSFIEIHCTSGNAKWLVYLSFVARGILLQLP